MATRLRKVRRQRGSRTHGWGQIGQHRHSGSRGGTGMAGLHKHKWSYTVKYAPDHFGSNTFRPPNSESTERWANIFDLERLAGNSNELDLTSLGYQKLLGQGEINRSLKVRVGKASSSAIEKVKAAGGSIELEKTKEEPIEEKVKGKQQSTPESRSIDTKSKGQK